MELRARCPLPSHRHHRVRHVYADNSVAGFVHVLGEDAASATEVNDGAFSMSDACKFLDQPLRRVVRDATVPGIVNVG